MQNRFVQGILACFLLTGFASAQTSVVLDDFSGGVSAKKQATGGGDYVTWYDSLNKASGQPAASSDPVLGAMKVSGEDTVNGIYRVFQAAVPSSGQWHVNCKIRIFEASPFNIIKNFQVGVIVNGVHRGTGNSKLAPASIYVDAPSWYITPGDDTAKGFRNLRTPDFTANAGDNLLVSLGTDVTSGNFNLNSGQWGNNFIIIDDIILEAAGLPVSVSSWTLE